MDDKEKKIPLTENSWLYSQEEAADSQKETPDPKNREEEPEKPSSTSSDPREISEDDALTGEKKGEGGRPAPDLDYSDVEISVPPLEFASSGPKKREEEKRKEPGTEENGKQKEKEKPEDNKEEQREQKEKDSKPETADTMPQSTDDADDAYDLDETEHTPLSVRFSRIREKVKISLAAKSYLLVIGAVLIVAILATCISHFWRYTGYRVISTHAQEDTSSFSYCNAGGSILRYGSEGATLYDRQNQDLWDISYTMDTPAVSINGEVFAIYDQAGTTVVVCNQSGQIGTFSTTYPVVRAAVNPDGLVATIQESGSETWVEYYSSDGKKIAEMKTALDDPGYPMSISLSDDGTLLGITYISYQDGVQTGSVDFYNFGSAGQNQMDNRVAEFTFSGRIIPELDYLSGTGFVAFRDNGFTIYQGATVPEQKADVTVDGDIVSVFHDDTTVGLVLAGDSDNTFQMQLYNMQGRKILQKELDFTYQTVDLVDGKISFYGTSGLHVYTTGGVCKFSGDYAESVQEMFAIGAYRYVAVADQSEELIRLK